MDLFIYVGVQSVLHSKFQGIQAYIEILSQNDDNDDDDIDNNSLTGA